MNPEAFGHFEFFVPHPDEETVVVNVSNTVIAHAHGHQWTPGKHWAWFMGQTFGDLLVADVLLAGHLHHFFFDTWGKKQFLQVGSLESESTWYKHRKGVPGFPSMTIAIVGDGMVSPFEVIS